MSRFFVCFFLFFVFSCKESDLLIKQPQDVRKVYEQKNEQSLVYLISLSGNENRYIADVGIYLLGDALKQLNDPKNKTYKKSLAGKEKDFVSKITDELISLFYKDSDFNTKNLILLALKETQNDERVGRFFKDVVVKGEPSQTKVVLSFIKKIEPEELVSFMGKVEGEKRLYLLNYYLKHYQSMTAEDGENLNKILSEEKDPYIKNLCLSLLKGRFS